MDITKYKTLCWDLDGTLFDHRSTSDFARYILNNDHDQRHVIVTHRTHFLVDQIEDELEALGLSADNFDFIHYPTDEMYELYQMALHLGGKDDTNYINWVEWKGEMCSGYENALMIDDNAGVVAPGCRKYGIDLIHPDHVVLP